MNNAAMKFDLHIHTEKSHDSLSSVASIVRFAKKRRLSGIAITDHGISAGDELRDLALESGIWIIRGNEVQTDIGDVLGLFISKKLKQRKAADLIDEIHEQGGIAILAHPFKYTDHYPAAVLKKLDAIEIVNARWKDLNRTTGNPKVLDLVSTVRGRSAGSDAHFPFEVGRACWSTPPLRSPDDLKKSIREAAGKADLTSYSGWLDEASQCVKFLKQPSAKQLARILYWSTRRLLLMPRSGL